MTIRDSDIAAVIEAYTKDKLSFVGVARRLGISCTSVGNIMREHAPDSVRLNINTAGGASAPRYRGLTQAALGLYAIGPCTACGTPLVSPIREKGQACGFCRVAAPRSRIFQRRAA